MAATADMRMYLDADVVVSPELLGQIFAILDRDAATYTSGEVFIPRPQSRISQAYARIYRRIPFMATGVPGCGLFAVNKAGRARWGEFPDIISDDTFVRLNFRPNERIRAATHYDWPLVEGLRNLIKVRRRQDAGVVELKSTSPALFDNDDKARITIPQVLGLAIRDPFGFVIYSWVVLYARLTVGRTGSSWVRGR